MSDFILADSSTAIARLRAEEQELEATLDDGGEDVEAMSAASERLCQVIEELEGLQSGSESSAAGVLGEPGGLLSTMVHTLEVARSPLSFHTPTPPFFSSCLFFFLRPFLPFCAGKAGPRR